MQCLSSRDEFLGMFGLLKCVLKHPIVAACHSISKGWSWVLEFSSLSTILFKMSDSFFINSIKATQLSDNSSILLEQMFSHLCSRPWLSYRFVFHIGVELSLIFKKYHFITGFISVATTEGISLKMCSSCNWCYSWYRRKMTLVMDLNDF